MCLVQRGHITLTCPQLSLAKQDVVTSQKCFCAPEQTEVTVLRVSTCYGEVEMCGPRRMLCLQGISRRGCLCAGEFPELVWLNNSRVSICGSSPSCSLNMFCLHSREQPKLLGAVL